MEYEVRIGDAIVKDPWITVPCIIKEIDGSIMFLNPLYKDIQTISELILKEVKFLILVRE